MTQSNRLILIAAVLIIGGLLWYGSNKRVESPVEAEKTEEQASSVASVTVNYGEGNVDSFSEVEYSAGATALEVTQSAVDVTTSGEGQMAFVTAIGDREADNSKNEFWLFKINGEAQEVGAGTYEVQDEDDISWEISTY